MKARWWMLSGFAGVLLIGMVSYAEKETILPEAVAQAIAQLFPQGRIEESKVETEGLSVFEVEVEQDGIEAEVTIARDGSIIEMANPITRDDLPEAVATALTGIAENGTIEEILEETEYYVVILKELDQPKISYEAEILKDGREITIEVAADGTILEQKTDDGDRQAGQEDEDDDDD